MKYGTNKPSETQIMHVDASTEMLSRCQHFIYPKSYKKELHKKYFNFIDINIIKWVVLGTFKYFFNFQLRIFSEDVQPHSSQVGRRW